MPRMTAPCGPPGRIAAIDVARGSALVGMAVYHLSWDLAYFVFTLSHPPPADAQHGRRLAHAALLPSDYRELATQSDDVLTAIDGGASAEDGAPGSGLSAAVDRVVARTFGKDAVAR